jgi:hypothetical protein
LKTGAGRVSLLAMLVLDIFIVPVLLSTQALPLRVGDLVFAITMLIAMNATGTGKGRRTVLAIGLAAFAIQFFRFVDHGHVLVILDAALSAPLPAWRVLPQPWDPTMPVRARVWCA